MIVIFKPRSPENFGQHVFDVYEACWADDDVYKYGLWISSSEIYDIIIIN